MPLISIKYFSASSPSVFGPYPKRHSVRQIRIFLPRLEEYVISYYNAVPVGIWRVQEIVTVRYRSKS